MPDDEWVTDDYASASASDSDTSGTTVAYSSTSEPLWFQRLTGQRLAAELLGTGWVVFAVISISIVALLTGSANPLTLPVATGAAVATALVASRSLLHLNPAITLGLAVAGRMRWAHVPPLIAMQLIGGGIAAGVSFVIYSGSPAVIDTLNRQPVTTLIGRTANGFAEASPANYGLLAVLLLEIIVIAALAGIVLATTRRGSTRGAVIVGYSLASALAYLLTFLVTNGSGNFVISLARAVFGGGDALVNLWPFAIATLIGAFIAGLVYQMLVDDEGAPASFGWYVDSSGDDVTDDNQFLLDDADSDSDRDNGNNYGDGDGDGDETGTASNSADEDDQASDDDEATDGFKPLD